MSNTKLMFIYDKMMTKEEQTIGNLNLKFLSYGCIKGKSCWIRDRALKRIYIVPPKGLTTKMVYGGIFAIQDYEENKHKLFSYYSSTSAYTGEESKWDIFAMRQMNVTPIKFNTIKDIKNCTFTTGVPIECSCFIGNPLNARIKYNSERYRYYKVPGIDIKNFIKLIKERNKKEETLDALTDGCR